MRRLLIAISLMFSAHGFAMTSDEILKQYEIEAKKENPAFLKFSAERGERFYHAERVHSNGTKVSCATCHTADPRQQGKTRANKIIEPMAARLNAERFTDPAKVEKWFGRNCKDVLERACTSQEKGDYIQYLVNLK
ncbi:MAG TPA: hypothetical protein DCO68_08990 [Methylophilaceae bacterium]|nr:hypothetical protein [Methylophilaceae bacterium]HAJ72200.1 hypothetical protein [Methylophilaceae bacterium]